MQIHAYAIATVFIAVAETGNAQSFHPDIPKAWDDAEVARFEMPLAQRGRSPRYMSAEEYHALRVRPIYRSYPMYAPGRDPAGYIESLKKKEPEIIFDPSKLRARRIGYRPASWCLNPKPFSGRRLLAAPP